MASTADRFNALVDANLDSVGGSIDWDKGVEEQWLNSLTVVAFIKAVNTEFGIDVPLEAAFDMTNLRDLRDYVVKTVG